MSKQLLVVPSSTKNLVDESGLASRNLQLWFSGVTNNSNQNGTDIGILQGQVTALQANIVFPPGGIIWWPDADPVPAGWTPVDSFTIGLNTYKLIQHP